LWAPSHHATETHRWLTQARNGGGDGLTYHVKWKMEWEPYLAVEREGLPAFDMRFEGVWPLSHDDDVLKGVLVRPRPTEPGDGDAMRRVQFPRCLRLVHDTPGLQGSDKAHARAQGSSV
jgi:hypothetical protein